MMLGELLKQTRQKQFLTQDEMSALLGVAVSTVNRWETGKAKPNIKTMKKIKEFCEEHKLAYDDLENAWLSFRLEGK